MRIDAIDLYLTKNPLIKPWTTAYGSDADVWSVLVKMTSGDQIGWGETCPLYAPTYSPEYAEGVFTVIKTFMAPLVIGKEFGSPEDLLTCLSLYKGNSFAKAGLEMAWWALESNITGKPLHELFGGSYRKVAVGADFGIQDSVDTLLGLIDGAFQAGFPRVKLKAAPGWDLNMLEAVRSTFPTQTFHIDCNSGYTLDDLPLFKKIDKLGLAMIEQPLCNVDVIDHAKLQSVMDTPICLDESINSVYAAEKAIELKACRIMNLKPGRIGGLSAALKVKQMCQDAGIGCWVGSMIDTSVGCGVWVELSATDNITYPGDVLSYHLYKQDIHGGVIELTGPGYIMPTTKSGNPYVPDPEILKMRTAREVHLEA